MSTPAWKKEARRKEHAAAKRKREYEKLFASTPKSTKKEFKEYVPQYTPIRETEYIPSLSTSDSIPGNGTGKPERKEYTGDYIVGIATMHKSNLVPVSRGVDPKDFATMRRN
jgi:hypothetical protein